MSIAKTRKHVHSQLTINTELQLDTPLQHKLTDADRVAAQRHDGHMTD